MSRGKSIENVGRAPVPEWEELARAAWPGRVPLALSAWFGRSNLTFFTLSMLVLFAAAWFHLPWVALVAWTISGLSEWLSTRSDPPTSRLMDLVGLRPQLRALLRSVLAAAAIFAGSESNSPTAGMTYVTVILMVQLAWVMQPILATWTSRTAPVLLFHPRAARQPAPTLRHQRIYARGAGTPLVLFLIELIALADGVIAEYVPAQTLSSLLGVTVGVAMAETALLYAGWTAWQAYAARRDVAKMGRPLIEKLTELAPSFLVYISLGAGQSKYIANQWLPALNALTEDGLLLVREASQLGGLDHSRHPVIYAPAPRDVERLLLPTIKVAFYLAFGERNGQLQRDPRLKHVMLLHGDSDKATSANNLARGVDEVWVAGQAAMDRYPAAGITMPRERFAVIGRPQVTELPIGPTGNEHPIVLYAPTFEGYYDQTSYSSLDRMGVRLVRRLLRDYPDARVWFRPHPASGVSRPSMLTAIAEISTILRRAGKGHLVTGDEDLSLTECLSKADVLISDISSVATDFLYTTRPILVCNPRGLSAEEFVEMFPSQSSSYVISPDLSGLDEGMAEALGPDRLKPARIEMKKHVLGDTPEGPQAAFQANVTRVTQG